jgi:hypothetical protein
MILFKIQSLSTFDPVIFNGPRPLKSALNEQPLSIGGRFSDLDDTISSLSESYMYCQFHDSSHEPRKAALVPRTTRIDDYLVVLRGGRFPFVLRRLRKPGWELVGPAQIRDHGWPAESSNYRWTLSKDRSSIDWHPKRLRLFIIY